MFTAGHLGGKTEKTRQADNIDGVWDIFIYK
jgi:hypothetical protein